MISRFISSVTRQPPAASRHLHDDFFVCAQGGVVHQVAIIKDEQNASMKQYIMSPWSLGS